MAKRKWWEGGYYFASKSGRDTYVIERDVGGHRFHVSTRRSTRRGALEELERFEQNPGRYKPQAEAVVVAVKMTPLLVEEFLVWQETEKRNTPRYVKDLTKYLGDWAEDFDGEDLRNVTLGEHVDPALAKRKGARPHRIAAIKVFYSWLRTRKRLLKTADDCTLDLLVPQAVPAKRRKKKAVDLESVSKVMNALPARYRDVLLFMASTGWHITEVQRFARDKRSELVELTEGQARRDHCRAVAKTWHKGKVWTVTPIITEQHLEAAKRIRAAGTFPRNFNKELKATAIALGGNPKTGAPLYFPLGVMRHSFSTWQVQGGADPKRVSIALNHKNERTTSDFYIDVNVPRSDLPAIDFPARETVH